ncbi:MAG: transcription antitermination factor NusB, partial [Coriobacteriia bacterium]|nr:transcription antitermination factor NusB [Coriobacteriia bacterium]
LLAGITEKKDFLDQRISHASSNWSIDRMPAVDKSILRLAAYEVLFMDEIPVSVAINEAVNLAKSFGGDDSPRFVNGILGKIANAPKSAESASEPVVHTTADELVQPTEEEAVAAILEAIATNDDDVEG